MLRKKIRRLPDGGCQIEQNIFLLPELLKVRKVGDHNLFRMRG